MNTKKRGLGRGLDALLGSVATPPTTGHAEAAGEELRELELGQLGPGRRNPMPPMRRSGAPKWSMAAMGPSIKPPAGRIRDNPVGGANQRATKAL